MVLHFEKWNCYTSYGYKQQTVLALTVNISGKLSAVHHYKKSVPSVVLSECSVSKYLKESYASETRADTCYFHLDRLCKSLVTSSAVADCHS